MHRRVVAVVVGVVLVAAVAAVLVWRLAGGPSTYESALATMPAATLRTTYTDWQVVRDQAHGSLGPAPSASSVERFLGRAYDLDLTSGSGTDESTAALQRLYGFSGLDAQWEALGQSRQGQVDVMRLDGDVDLPGIERRLRRLGYTPPAAGSDTGGTWTASPELVTGLDGSLTPVQQNLVVLGDQHLVLMSDDAVYASAAARVARGDDPSVLDRGGVSSLASRAGSPATAVQWTSTFACEDLTMGTADDDDQATGKQLVAKAGGIGPYTGLVMAQQPDRQIVLGLHFQTSEAADRNLQGRVDLASGPAPGQGGSFRDRFTVTSGETHGQDVVLDLRPVTRRAVLSDVSTGPVLFATC